MIVFIQNLNDNELPVAPIESFGLIGNWLIRANGVPSSGSGDLALQSAASVKGGFAIDLPLTGPSGVEDRSGGPNQKYSIVMTFNEIITSVSSASSSCGSVQSFSVDPTDDHKVIINLAGVAHGCNGTDVTVSAIGIGDDQGDFLGLASAKLGLLLGDVNGDRVVDNRNDVRAIKTDRGAKTNSANFREDVNSNGRINNEDAGLAIAQVGTSLP